MTDNPATDAPPADGVSSPAAAGGGSGAKRTAEEAGLTEGGQDGAKTQRPDEAAEGLAALDPAVRSHLEAFFTRGVLTAAELDVRAVQQLGTFTPEQGVEILDQFERAGLKNVRNKSAYLGGVMSRFLTKGTSHLHPDLQYWIHQLYTSNKVKQGDLDARCIEVLEAMPLATSVRFLERFHSKDFVGVRNVSALFMSSMKQAESEGHHHHHGGPRGPPDHYGRGPPDRGPSYSEPHSQPPPPGYAPPHQRPTPSSFAVPMGGIDLEGRRNWSAQQYQVGLRTDEFHNLSVFAPYVHPATALKLQTIWDQGVRLVSLLDDRAWEALSDLGVPQAAAAIDETAEALQAGRLRNPNAFFMSVSRKHLDEQRHSGAPPAVVPYGGAYRYLHTRTGGGGSGNAAHGGYGGGSGRRPEPALEGLPPLLRRKVLDLLASQSRYLRESHFDNGVLDALRRMPEEEALAALAEASDMDLGVVRNFPAYLMGITKRYKEERPR